MNPFYFGESAAPLYGILHEPCDGPYRPRAVLICQPIGHEYLRTHRMLQLLASRLAESGYFCLRFDYLGTGDSFGEFSDMDLLTWQKNVGVATEELRAISGVDEVVCIGLRLGAFLALEMAPECHFNQFIMWDPVFSGESYLSGLESLQLDVLANKWHFNQIRSLVDLEEGEYLGFVYSRKLREQLMTKQLASEIQLSETPMLCFSTEKQSQDTSTDIAGHMTCTYITDEGDWQVYKDIDKSISTHNINRLIIESLE